MASTNYIEKVAIVGVTGRIGSAFAEALVQTGKHSVTGLTRVGSSATVPAGVKAVQVDYSDEAALETVFRGQQFVVLTLKAGTPPDTHERLVKAAVKAGVPYIMPNTYGSDHANDALALKNEDMFSGTSRKLAHGIKELGASYITLCCGFWYQWSLALGEPWFGIDIKSRKVTFFDQGTTKINVSTWPQCGRALAGLLSLPESGASPCVADWKNGIVYIDSFRVSQRDMLDSLNRVLGTTDKDWHISYQPSHERYQMGLDQLKTGDRLGFGRAMYSRIFFPSGEGDFESLRGLDNDKLGLHKEDLDQATREAVQLAEDEWNPFGAEMPNLRSGGK